MMKKFFFREKMHFWKKPEIVILHDGNFVRRKRSLHPCLTFWRGKIFVDILSSEKNQLQF